MPEEYKDQICGLCGNFDGKANDFTDDGSAISVFDFAEIHKANSPRESCEEPEPTPDQTCAGKAYCKSIFTSAPFSSCQDLLDTEAFIKVCMADKCYSGEDTDSMLCKTVGEFSRHVCTRSRWQCSEDNCSGTCSVTGGSHVDTFDGKKYVFHGDCTYVLAKQSTGSLFSVLVDLEMCGVSQSKTCLRAVTVAFGSNMVMKIHASGQIHVNQIRSQLPLFNSELIAFKPSSSYIFVKSTTGLKISVQLIPSMQVFLIADASLKGTISGLCGNFNNKMNDDFMVATGLVESTAAGFVNTWKTKASCPDITTHFGHPCNQGINREKFARYWCSKLVDPKGAFAACHQYIDPETYKENCMYDCCNSDNSDDSLCAAVSAYVFACSERGIQISGWRNSVCGEQNNKDLLLCPEKTVYSYNMTSCQRTCQSLSQPDYTCQANFVTVDGCGCAQGTYMNDKGQCVTSKDCPCHDIDDIILAGQSVTKNGHNCICKHGALKCPGGSQQGPPQCNAPMVYFDCSSAQPGDAGTECEKSCSTLDMACVPSGCTSGCMCPKGLVSDGEGGCVQENKCPCVHNGKVFHAGETLTVDCNTCTCSNRKFRCTENMCDAVCGIYGDGHYVTFDDKRFDFNGQCEYTLLQDSCGDSQGKGSFSIVTENVACGSTGTTCSRVIKIFLGDNEFHLRDGNFHVVKGSSKVFPHQVHKMGIYLVVTIRKGLVLMWDQKTSLFIKLDPKFQGKVCGLCGNYDGNSKNDFTTPSEETVADVLEFGNSWKVSSSCPNAQLIPDPCATNGYRSAWSKRQCSIIISVTFNECHSQVDPGPYFDSCVRDTCACDTGGDCECFCTAVAAYAKACNEAGACVRWRTPKLCPIFCDYYNAPDGCEWHYKPCGAPCMKTCRNPSGKCSKLITAIEGCYPQCPPTHPFFDEDSMKCVSWEQCGCFDDNGNHYGIGDEVESRNCYTWKDRSWKLTTATLLSVKKVK
ncbi:mucin-5AC-like [Notolabrus celidotus]|uniref:mucin-5AC-like n=1 Tax=Notolabrus celidotus TaxID=1203425 RepID=UPI00148FC57D|nr:mucin-5AC-like [Notolabrus celidotus]